MSNRDEFSHFRPELARAARGELDLRLEGRVDRRWYGFGPGENVTHGRGRHSLSKDCVLPFT